MNRFQRAWSLHHDWGGFWNCPIEYPLWGEGYWTRLRWLWVAWITVRKEAEPKGES